MIQSTDKRPFKDSVLYCFLVLFFVCLFASWIRLFGISHSLGAHPDERHIMMVTGTLSWDNLNPKSFAYGSLPFYLLRSIAGIFNKVGYDQLFIVGRSIMVILALATIICTFVLSRIVGLTTFAALLATAFLSLNIFHIQLSHFFTVDPILTFTSILSLIFICQIIKSGSWWSYVLAGALVGCSLAVKVSALNLLLPLGLAHLIGTYIRRANWLKEQLKPVSTFFAIVFFATATQPYLILNRVEFFRQVKEQINMVKGIWIPPYTVQYLNTKPYIYPLEQMFNYTIGIPLIFSLVGILFFILAKNSTITMRVIALWAIAVFFVIGQYQVKFPRYLLPIYPILFIAAANIVSKLKFSKTIATVLLLPSLIHALAWTNIYRYDHGYKVASEWVFQNIPAGSEILGVHWDDKVPTDMPGFSSHQYKMWERDQELGIYEQDNDQKLESISKQLNRGDYLIFPTQRVPGSILQAPERFKDSAPLLQLLYANQLGYQLIKTVKIRPKLMSYSFNDDLADESFSVYDHPKITIFKNIEHLSPEVITARVRSFKDYPNLPNRTQVLLTDKN